MSESDSEEAPEAPRRRRRRRKAVNLAWWAEVEYAYLNLDSPDEEPLGAPSSGSIGLLKWARSNRNTFFRLYVSRFPASRAAGKREQEAPPEDEGKALLDEVMKRYTTTRPDAEPAAPRHAREVSAPQPPALEEGAAPVMVNPRPLLCGWCERNGPQENCGGCYDLHCRTAQQAASSRGRERYDGPYGSLNGH